MINLAKFKKSLSIKLMAPLALLVAVIILSVNGFIMARVNSLALEQAMLLGENMGARYGNAMQKELELAIESSQMLTETLSGLKKTAATPDRQWAIKVLEQVQQENPQYLGVWAGFEANAWDGLDARYANTPGSDANGRFIPYWNFVGGLHMELLGETSTPWYQVPLTTGKDYLTDPTVYEIAGQEVMVVSACIPIKHNGQSIGVAGVDIGMERLAELTGEIKPFETGYAYLVSNSGMYVAHPDQARVGKQLNDYLEGQDRNAVMKAIQNGQHLNLEVKGVKGMQDSFIIYNPFPLGETGISWSLAVVVPKDRILAGNRLIGRISNIVGLLGIMAIILMIFFIARIFVINPVNEVKAGLRDIAEGEGDLTMRLKLRSEDEISQLALFFNKFMENLEEVVTQVKDTAGHVDTSTQEVSSGSLGLSQSSQEQASAVEEVAATIEEMTSTIKQNADNANTGQARSQDAENSIRNGDQIAQDLLKAMTEISDASKKIGDIIATVNEVAFQTNLLALNAAVEAARAGEHGKGFAVVAEEVRALAQRSASAVGEVRNLIEDTVNKVKTGDAMVSKTAEAFVEIRQQIDALAQTMEEIAAASSEQASGIDELNRAVAQIDSSTQVNASTVEELSSAADALSVEAGGLAKVVERFKVSKSTSRPQKPKTKAPAAPPTAPKARAESFSSDADDGFEEF